MLRPLDAVGGVPIPVSGLISFAGGVMKRDNKNANTGSRITLLEMNRSIDAIPCRDQHPHRTLLDCSVDLPKLHKVISIRPNLSDVILMIGTLHANVRHYLNEQGEIEGSLLPEGGEIWYLCPECGDHGVITGWKRTSWDRSAPLEPQTRQL
jgi:hypothetical protein